MTAQNSSDELPSVILATPETCARFALGVMDLIASMALTIAIADRMSMQIFEEDLKRRAGLLVESDPTRALPLALMLERLGEVAKQLRGVADEERMRRVLAGTSRDGATLN